MAKRPGAWTTYAPENTVVNAVVAEGDYVWTGTNGDGVIRWSRADGTFVRFTAASGLVDGRVRAIAVDGRGHTWFGTEGGLSEFDGQAWTTYTTTHGLAHDKVLSIAWDIGGRVWFATWGGVSQFDGHTWTLYNRTNGLPSDHVYSIAIDKTRHVWAATPNGAAEFDGQTWRIYRVADGLVNNWVHAIVVDADNHKWFATPGGVSEFDGRVWRTYTTVDGLVSNYVHTIAIDKAGNKWFATYYGVSKFDGHTWRTFTTAEGLPRNHVTSIATDEAGHLWLGAFDGVIEFDGATWIAHAYVAGSLADKRINAIAVDQSGLVWVGADEGVSAFDGHTWTTYTTSDGLPLERVVAIAIDQDDHKWFGTWSSGVAEFDGRTWKTYTTSHGLASNHVPAIAIDQDGHKWFGTRNGVSEFDDQTWKTYTSAHGLADDYVSAVAIDQAGHKWFGTSKGVSEFDGKTWRTYTTTHGLLDDSVLSVGVDQAGHKWFGSENGISEFDGQTWITHTSASGLPTSSVWAVAADRSGNVWLGSYFYGVAEFDGRVWRTYTTGDGLAHNHVTAIAVDKAGHKWFATYGGGVSELDESANTMLAYAPPPATPIVPMLKVTPAPLPTFAPAEPQPIGAPMSSSITSSMPALIAQIPLAPAGAELHDLLLDSDAGRVYIVDSSGPLRVLDSTTYQGLATLLAVEKPRDYLLLDTANKRLYAHSGWGNVYVVDTASLTVTGSLSGGSVAVDSKRNRVYVGNRVYDGATLKEVEALPRLGWPTYNPVRDDLLLGSISALAFDLETHRMTRDVLPEFTAQPCYDCGGVFAVSRVHVFPAQNLIVIESFQNLPGKGGRDEPPRYFDATTLDELDDLAGLPAVWESCSGITLAEPVNGLTYREAFFSWGGINSNLLVYGPDGDLKTWRDGLRTGLTNPATGQIYVAQSDSVLVLDLATLSLLERLPVDCVYRLDSETGRIYARRGGDLVMFSQQGGGPAQPSHGNPGPLPAGEIKAIRVSPGYADDHTLFLVLYEPLGDSLSGDGVYRSTDGGRTWVKLSGDLPHMPSLELDLEISPDFAHDHTLFVGGSQHLGWGVGVYRSTDGGDTWQGVWNGLNYLYVYDVAVSPNYSKDGTLLAYSTYRRVGLIGQGSVGNAVFRSTDRGLTWSLVVSDTEPIGSETLPTPDTLLPQVSSIPVIQFRLSRGVLGNVVYRSMNGGQNWTEVRVSDRSIAVLYSPNFTADHTVYVVAEDAVFRSTDNGDTWERSRDKRWAERDYGSRLTIGVVSPSLKDGSHQLFIGTAKGEFWALNPAAMTWEPERLAPQWPTLLEDKAISQIKVSPGGNLWFGTRYTLFHYASGAIQASYTVSIDLPIEYDLFDISVAPDGKLWVIGGGGATSFDGKAWTYYDLRQYGYLSTITTMPDGSVWVGGDLTSILRWNGQTWESVGAQGLYDIESDHSGTFWLARPGGLSWYNGKTWSHKDIGDSYKVAFGSDGAAYVLTRIGIRRYAAGKSAVLPEPTGKYSRYPDSSDALYVAADGAVWWGTEDGAFRYDGQTWRQFSTRHGLPGNRVYAIVEDADGWLWFGTDRGAARVDPRTLNLSPVVWR
jgi:ligand-binding sensor domain-containing protein